MHQLNLTKLFLNVNLITVWYEFLQCTHLLVDPISSPLFIEVQIEYQLRPYNSEGEKCRTTKESKLFLIASTSLEWYCSPFQISYALLLLGFSWNLHSHGWKLLFLHLLTPPQHPAHGGVFLLMKETDKRKIYKHSKVVIPALELTSL